MRERIREREKKREREKERERKRERRCIISWYALKFELKSVKY